MQRELDVDDDHVWDLQRHGRHYARTAIPDDQLVALRVEVTQAVQASRGDKAITASHVVNGSDHDLPAGVQMLVDATVGDADFPPDHCLTLDVVVQHSLSESQLTDNLIIHDTNN
jgi:hypothetical protein